MKTKIYRGISLAACLLCFALGMLFGINIILHTEKRENAWDGQPMVAEAAQIGAEDVTGYNGDTFRDNGHPYCIKVNRSRNVVTVYTLDEDGYYTIPYKAMVCSVGLNDKTPTGTFKLQRDRYEWRELVGQVYGQYAVRIHRSIMFHSVPYYSPQKDELEREEFNKLGEPASKGCIRLTVADSKWIYDNCEKGTIVQIFDSDYIGPWGKPTAQKLDTSSGRQDMSGSHADEPSQGDEPLGTQCWDPTDIHKDSLWYHEEPYIFGAESVSLDYEAEFDLRSGVSAYDCNGKDLTAALSVNGSVDTSVPGNYIVIYRVTDGEGRQTRVEREIRVADADGRFFEEHVPEEDATEADGDKTAAADSEGNPPVIVLRRDAPDTLTVEQAGDEEYMKSLVEVTDESGLDSLTVSLPLWVSRKMSYRVVYIARDIHGNIATVYYKFSIE